MTAKKTPRNITNYRSNIRILRHNFIKIELLHKLVTLLRIRRIHEDGKLTRDRRRLCIYAGSCGEVDGLINFPQIDALHLFGNTF